MDGVGDNSEFCWLAQLYRFKDLNAKFLNSRSQVTFPHNFSDLWCTSVLTILPRRLAWLVSKLSQINIKHIFLDVFVYRYFCNYNLGVLIFMKNLVLKKYSWKNYSLLLISNQYEAHKHIGSEHYHMLLLMHGGKDQGGGGYLDESTTIMVKRLLLHCLTCCCT
jgi:hypothetical protein